MKITIEELKKLIFEALEEVTHDTQTDGIESMQHQLETEKPKGRKKKKRKLTKK